LPYALSMDSRTKDWTEMDDRLKYEKSEIIDYGSLEELTAGCLGATGGDSFVPSGHLGEFSFGPSFNNSAIQCSSK
jgi:hypothetical protein